MTDTFETGGSLYDVEDGRVYRVEDGQRELCVCVSERNAPWGRGPEAPQRMRYAPLIRAILESPEGYAVTLIRRACDDSASDEESDNGTLGMPSLGVPQKIVLTRRGALLMSSADFDFEPAWLKDLRVACIPVGCAFRVELSPFGHEKIALLDHTWDIAA